MVSPITVRSRFFPRFPCLERRSAGSCLGRCPHRPKPGGQAVLAEFDQFNLNVVRSEGSFYWLPLLAVLPDNADLDDGFATLPRGGIFSWVFRNRR